MAWTTKNIVVNLPVKNLKKSVAFFRELGFIFDPLFTDEQGTCMILGDRIYVMLLEEERFQTFTTKKIADAGRYTETILCISANSRQDVDELVNKALAAGGSRYSDPQDHGFMYGWSFQDPDGHLWEVMYMDESA
ncbi:VOC family protein [Paenibacillus thailandensis]|uniref:VOC family protein n=1 Tax=Paenibacillus thailandensis TaxID=393250 RepID=A0ABW5R2W8_9BACL